MNGLSKARRAVLLALGLTSLWSASTPVCQAQNLATDQILSKVLAEGEGWQVVSEGLGFSDGACSDAVGNFYFSDIPNRTVFKVRADGRREPFWKDAPRISGMKFGPDGRLYAAAHAPDRIVAFAPETKVVSPVADNFVPNDLVVTRAGIVYVTFTALGEVRMIDRQRRQRTVARGLARPNGIALTPDQGTLAISEKGGNHVWVFRVEPNGDLAFGEPWMDLRTPMGQHESGGDGMTMDSDGRAYVTSAVGIQMFDWLGRLGGVIAAPGSRPTVSVAFAGPGHAYLYACAGDKVFRRKTKVRGRHE